MKTPLYNTAHPLAGSGKPIFIPFGEWKYDGQSRQRLDRAHGEKIANELNARVAKGEPGIPVYQGHPDVPALAAKYPDKGALGWVVKIEIVNECCQCGSVANTNSNGQLENGNIGTGNIGNIKPGLALTVEWDRDPGRGFRWFSPYWLANSREGSTYIVDEIASIGLVNNPNIPEFRLANEEQPMKKKLNPAIIELAAKYDRLANEKALANVIDANGMGHDDDNGQFDGSGTGGSSGGSSGGSGGESQSSRLDRMLGEARAGVAKAKAKATAAKKSRIAASRKFHKELEAHLKKMRERRLALKKFNDKMAARLRNEANFDESKHPRSVDSKFTSGGGGSGGAASGKSPSPELKAKADAARAKAGTISPSAREWASDKIFLGAKDITHEGLAKRINSAKAENHASREDKSVRVERLRALHAKAISLGFRYNTATGNYE